MPGARRKVTRQSTNSGKIVTLGIDPSLTGYAMVAFFPETGDHREWLIKTTADADVYALRLAQIKSKVTQVVRDLATHHDLRLIAMERPAYAASGAFTGGLTHAATALGLLEALGPDDQRLRMPLPANNTLKKFVTGKGVGKKQLMVKFVYQKWGFDTTDDNLADAYGLARLAAAVTYGTSEHQYERDCIDTVRRSMTWEPLPPPAPSSPTSTPSPPGMDSRSSARALRRSSSGSATPATSSNSRRASPSPSATPRRSRSGA